MLLFALLAIGACNRGPPDVVHPSNRAVPAPAVEALQPTHVDMAGAQRFDSPQGYRILVAPGFTMTQEEPCCDQAWAQASPESFMRIEHIAAGIPLARLRADMELGLSALGPASPVDQPPPPPGHEVELQLGAGSGDTRVLMSIHRVGDARYRVTRHLRASAPERTADAMQAMLGTLDNTRD